MFCLFTLFAWGYGGTDWRRIRADSKYTLTGYINVVIMDMALASLHRRNMLMSAEWYSPFSCLTIQD